MDRENGVPKNFRRAPRKKARLHDPSTPDRLPPHSDAAEQGVLGCILLDAGYLPDCLSTLPNSGAFYDLRNRTIYECMAGMFARGELIDILTVQESLRDDGQLSDAGGIPYLAGLPDVVPAAANLAHYTKIVAEKAALRSAIDRCTDIIARAYDHPDRAEVDGLLADFRRDLDIYTTPQQRLAGTPRRFAELAGYDTAHDPNTLLGVRSDRTTSRYLCRGGSGWIIGASGIGKSSLAITMAVFWAAGLPIFGIRPARPLRITIIQAENDEGDMAEMVRGLQEGLHWTDFDGDAQRQLVHENLKVRTEVSRIGLEFTRWLESVIREDRAEIVLLDPFLSFGGFDVSKQEQCSQFLRSWLNPVLQRTGAAVLGMHHTGKPKADRRTKGVRAPTALEEAYDGLGSSELVNWARLVMNLSEAGDGLFRLKLTKRANRSGATHPNDQPTNVIWLKQGSGRIWWEQVDPPEGVEEKPKEKRKTKPEQVATMNTASFLRACTDGGESLRGISKRLADWSMSKAAPSKVDLSPSTARAAIVLMVVSEKLECRDGLYYRGENA